MRELFYVRRLSASCCWVMTAMECEMGEVGFEVECKVSSLADPWLGEGVLGGVT